MADAGLMFKTVFTTTLVLTLFLSVQGAPADLQKETGKNCTDSDDFMGEENKGNYVVVDHRQTGKGNLRINVKDIAVVWAPAETLLAAAALLDPELFGDALFGSGGSSEQQKPQEGQNQEQSPVVLEVIESKPLEENSSSTKPPEKEGQKEPAINPTTKPASMKRSGLRYTALLESLLKKKQ